MNRLAQSQVGRLHVAVTYVGDKERAEQTVSEVEAAGCRAWSVHLEQASATMPDEVVASTIPHFGRLDVLVNNAAWKRPRDSSSAS
jgi:3-oxoacyl-[acyl-carrier protein] reductase